MQVKNIQMQGNIEMFIDFIERELIKSNIRYVKIIEDDYYEIHFLDYIYKIYHTHEFTKTLLTLLEEFIIHKNENIFENIFFNNKLNYKDFNPVIMEKKRVFEELKDDRKFFENKYNKVKVNTKGFKNNFRRR